MQTGFGCVLKAQPKPHILTVLNGPDSNLCFSTITPSHLCHQIRVVFDERGNSAPWAIASTPFAGALLANSSHGLGKQGLGIYGHRCYRKNAGMNALFSIITPKV